MPRCSTSASSLRSVTFDDVVVSVRPGQLSQAMYPQLLFSPIQYTGQRRSQVFRARCKEFLAGHWQALYDARPVPITAEERSAITAAADARRGFVADSQQDLAIKAMQDGRISQGLQILVSEGVRANSATTRAQLASEQIPVPVQDSLALSEDEQTRYDAAIQLDQRYLDDEQHMLDPEDIISFLAHTEFGVGAGSTGSCFEHLASAAQSATGRSALLELVESVACGQLGGVQAGATHLHLDDAGRLTPLAKGETGLRPISSGECIGRVAGTGLLRSRKNRYLPLFAACHQYGCSPNGPLYVTTLLKVTHQLHPDWLLITTDKKDAFQRASRSEMKRQVSIVLLHPETLTSALHCMSLCGENAIV